MSQNEVTYAKYSTKCEVCGITYVSSQKNRHKKSKHHIYHLYLLQGDTYAIGGLNMLERGQQFFEDAVNKYKQFMFKEKKEFTTNDETAKYTNEFNKCYSFQINNAQKISNINAKFNDVEKWSVQILSFDECMHNK